MKAKLALLVLGVLLGLGLAQLAPRFWHRLTPGALRGAPTVGSVESKRWDDERLLLTLITDGGAVLATFRERTAEIDLLVDVGDTVELGLARYRPFVEDPGIDRVVKARDRAAGEVASPEEPAAAPPAVDGPADDSAPDEDALSGSEEGPAAAGDAEGDEPGDMPGADPPAE